jgi:adenine phosphoribosyltransferase
MAALQSPIFLSEGVAMDLAGAIRDVPDFPQPGILFKDITTLLKDPVALKEMVNQMLVYARQKEVDVIVGIESRGFIFGMPLAYELGIGFVPVRKPGKLPAETISRSYALEYGSNSLEIHRDAIGVGQKVLIVDDLLATGGTVNATCELVEAVGGDVVGLLFAIELEFLKGREKLPSRDIYAVVAFE